MEKIKAGIGMQEQLFPAQKMHDGFPRNFPAGSQGGNGDIRTGISHFDLGGCPMRNMALTLSAAGAMGLFMATNPLQAQRNDGGRQGRGGDVRGDGRVEAQGGGAEAQGRFQTQGRFNGDRGDRDRHRGDRDWRGRGDWDRDHWRRGRHDRWDRDWRGRGRWDYRQHYRYRPSYRRDYYYRPSYRRDYYYQPYRYDYYRPYNYGYRQPYYRNGIGIGNGFYFSW